METKIRWGIVGPGKIARKFVSDLLLVEDAEVTAVASRSMERAKEFAEEYDVERKFRETRLYRIAPISSNLILSFLAEHVLDLPRSY